MGLKSLTEDTVNSLVKEKKRTLVDVSHKFTMPGEVKRKKALAKDVEVQQPLSPLSSEEVQAFENLVAYLPDLDAQGVKTDQLPSYEAEVEDSESLPPLLEEKEFMQKLLYCPLHELPVHHNVSKNGWAYVTCAIENCPVWLPEEKADAILTGMRLTMHPDLREEALLCFCEEPARVGMSQKKWSRGRCFLTCRQKPACEYFRWVDQPMQIQEEISQVYQFVAVTRVTPSPRYAPYKNPRETNIEKQSGYPQTAQNQPRNSRKQTVSEKKKKQVQK